MREDNSLKDEVKHKLATVEILNSAYEEKLKADELYLQKQTQTGKTADEKGYGNIWKNSSNLFGEYSKAIYDEIIEK